MSMQPTMELPALELDYIASSEINSVCKRRKIRASRKVVFMLVIVALAIYNDEGWNAIYNDHSSFQIFSPLHLKGNYVTYLKTRFVGKTKNFLHP